MSKHGSKAPSAIGIKTFDTEEERQEYMKKVKEGKDAPFRAPDGMEIEAMTDQHEHFGQIGLQMILGCINDGNIEPLSALLIMLTKMKDDDEMPDWVRIISTPMHAVVLSRMGKTLKDESAKLDQSNKKTTIDKLAHELLNKDPEGMPN